MKVSINQVPLQILVLASIFFILLSFPLFVSNLAVAQNFEDSSREELLCMEIPMVTTATRTNQRATDAPATIIVVSRQQIMERGYNNLLDLLEDLPGVDLQNKSAQEMYNQTMIRGNWGSGKFIIMKDGYRISSPTAENIPIGENFPLYDVRQVEVVFGPASALYGADAFTGVINLITQDAEELDGWEVAAAAGSFKYYYGHIKYGGRLSKNVKLTMGGHRHRSDNADLTEYYDEYAPTDLTVGATVIAAADRENFIFRTGSYTGNLKLDIDDKFTLGYNRSYFSHPTSSGDKPDQSLFTDDVRWKTQLSTLYGEYRFESGDNLTGKTSMSHHTYELLPDSKYKNIYTDFQTGHKYAHSKKWMFEQQLNYKVRDNHTVTGGFSIEDFYSLPKTYDLLGKEYDPDKAGSEQGFFYTGTNNTIPVKIIELNYKNYGAYLQTQSKWSSLLSSTLGVRYDYNTRYKGATNPRGGVVITPGETTTVKLLYGEAFLAPSPYNAYAYHWGSFDQGYDAVKGKYVSSFMGLPNPDLEPEQSKTTEINIIQEVTPAFVLTLSAYYTRVKDMIFDVVQNTPSYYIEGGEVLAWKRLENVGTAKFYGGELLANYYTDIGGIKLKPWGSYSYVDGKVDNGSGIESDHIYVAKHKLKVGLTAAYSRYSITPIVRWIGKTNTRWVDPNDPSKRQQVEDYILVNLNMDARNVAKNLSVSVNVHNLLDKRYYNSGGGSSNFPSSPQEPRRIVLKLDYKY